MYHRVHISNIKNYHDDEHFYRTKISIFSPLKIEKLTAKDLKCSNEDKKTNFQKFIFQIPKSGVPGRYSKKRNSNRMKLGRSFGRKILILIRWPSKPIRRALLSPSIPRIHK